MRNILKILYTFPLGKKGTGGFIKLYLILFLALTINPSQAQESFEQLFEAGNEWYKKDSLQNAIISYEKAAEHYTSSALFYNLGNAYFQSGNLGKAILNFEKAKKYNPTDNSISHNLNLANLAVKDKIEPQVSPISDIISGAPTNLFTWLSIIFCFSTFAGLTILLVYKNKRTGTLLTVISAILFLFTLSLSATKCNLVTGEHQAIILPVEVDVLSAPSKQTGNKVYELHEGTKVDILRKENNWLEISTNGSIGWISIKDCGII